MQGPRYLIVTSVLMLFLVFPLAAEVLAGDLYAALHFGKNTIDSGEREGWNEDHYLGGLFIGYDLSTFKKTILSLEADFGGPLESGTTAEGGSWKLWTAGVYGCARIGLEAIYLKLKLGLIYEKLQAETLVETTQDDFGLSLGPGIGFRIGNHFFLEMEGTVLDKNIGVVRLAAGIHF